MRNKGKISQVYETSVSKKLVHTKQCLILLLEMNRASLCCQKRTTLLELSEEHFYSDHHLHGVIGNKHHFADKDFSTLLPIYSQKVCSFKYLFL